jgi:hypothetical protein
MFCFQRKLEKKALDAGGPQGLSCLHSPEAQRDPRLAKPVSGPNIEGRA